MVKFLRSASLLVASLLVVSACGGSDLQVTFDSIAPDLPSLDLFEQPTPDAPDPAARAGAASGYVQCAGNLSNGGWSPDFGPPAAASDPDGALATFLDEGLFSLPTDGYAAVGVDTDRVLYTYSVADTPKVAVIMVDSSGDNELGLPAGWVVETFATCDPSAYDASADNDITLQVWVDTDGNRAPTTTIHSLQGAEHCGWETVTYLWLMDRYYISDPGGVLPAPLVVPYSDDAALPADAVDTSFRRNGAELWISNDPNVAYLVNGDTVEAWPSPIDSNTIFCS